MKSTEPTPAAAFQARLVAAMQTGAPYPHPAEPVELLQTHISFVLLAGDYAYKIKKAVDLGFLDFRTLSSRRYFCDEELRLNRRTAAELYLDVVPITGSFDRPLVGGKGEAIEYAVRMQRFPTDSTLDRMLAMGRLSPAIIDATADRVAAFHQSISIAGPADGYGAPDATRHAARQNIDQILPLLRNSEDLRVLESYRIWLDEQDQELKAFFLNRLSAGFVRECHGDLHLGNIAWMDPEVVLFDCIEFDPGLRWIDVMNELAFLAMDLQAAGSNALSWRFVNRYLEVTGDYAGVAALRYFKAYRALVRAKVNLLRAFHQKQPDPTSIEAASRLIALANSYSVEASPAIVLTHGLSGSGKSSVSRALSELAGAIRIRSDVERKRLYGVATLDHRRDQSADELYNADATTATYNRLGDLSAMVVRAGLPVIVDAAFLRRPQRDQFRKLADQLKVPLAIVDLAADPETLRRRVAKRYANGKDPSDADLAVLERQIRSYEPLSDEENDHVFRYDTRQSRELMQKVSTWQPLLDMIGWSGRSH